MSESLRDTGGIEFLPQLREDLRVQLGLEPHESLRLIHRAGRLLTLERSGPDSSGPVVPWDRELVLTADVRVFALADLLRLIHAAGLSGFLLFCCGDQEKSVFLHRGEVVFATSNQKVDRLGESLLRSQVITPRQLREAEARFRPSARLGRILVDAGMLTPRELWQAVKAQVEEIVRSLFAYTMGSMHFWEGDVQPDNVVRLALPTADLIAEGLKRRDELLRFLALLEDPRTRLMASPRPGANLSASERILLDCLGCDGRFSSLCRSAGVDPLAGARTVRLLKLTGAIRVVREPRAAPGNGAGRARGGEEQRVRECAYNYLELLTELTAPLVALDGAKVIEERLARVVQEAGERHCELLADLPVGAGGSIDPEKLVDRALRLPGDRIRAVHEALGELAAYLEFEIRNHPGIDQPDLFLDAVEGLRAKLDA